MADFIDANQLKGAFTSMGSTAEECAKAFKKAVDCLGFVYNTDSSGLLVKESDYPLDATTIVSGTLSLSDVYNPTLMALQCKSCGAAIDRNSMTCTHCGMGYILVNDNGINPRYNSF